MKIAVLTSTRAEYGIYLPLLKLLSADNYFDLNIIAFGTHVSKSHGNTIDSIKKDGFKIAHTLNDLLIGDSPADIVSTMGNTISSFSNIWKNDKYDLVFALGDRYEMFAAVASTVPFNIPVAHIHGGETTLGAIDDCFRHSITHMSKYHFVTTEKYKNKVVSLVENDKNVFNVGALSIDNLKSLNLLDLATFKEKFNIDLSLPSILITFHPETVSFEKNEIYIKELIASLKEIKEYQLIITMPNADTMGNLIRKELNQFVDSVKNAVSVESFGSLGYLSCMKHCSFMLGNTSSGFVEAAYFPKYVINLGKRQEGRILTENIVSCEINKNAILIAVNDFKVKKIPSSVNIYGDGNAAEKIVKIVKQIKND